MTGNEALTPRSDMQATVVAEIAALHRKRIEIWLDRQVEAYLAFYWEDAIIFAVERRISVAEFREWLVALFAAGGGAITMEVPPVSEIAISPAGDAAVTSFTWRTRFRSVEGIESNQINHETNAWYRRNGAWKIIGLHLTRLSSTPAA